MIDKAKQYRTRDWQEARIYATDCGGDYPVHGAVRSGSSKQWLPMSWTANGFRFGGESEFDLIEIKPRIKRTVWLALHGEVTTLYQVRPSHLGSSCLAVAEVHVDCEYGGGL